MANEVKYPEAKYKIVNVGPSRSWSFKGDGGEDIQMVSYSLQLEGVAEWVDLGQKPETPAPEVNAELEGHIEDTGKFGYKFVKKRGAGGWGGKKDYSGAHYNSAVTLATQIVVGYYQVKGEKPEKITDMLDRIEQLTPLMKTMVDKFAGTEKKDESTTEDKPVDNTTPAPAPANGVVIDDVDEKELKW